jgi:hypothetical protein
MRNRQATPQVTLTLNRIPPNGALCMIAVDRFELIVIIRLYVRFGKYKIRANINNIYFN